MKQVFQDARSAEITVVEVPAPKLLAGCVLVRTAASVGHWRPMGSTGSS